MKKFIPVIVLSMAALVACNKNEPAAEMPVEGERSATLSFSVHGSATKSTVAGTADENAINTIDAFVFNHTGDLDAYGHYTSDDFTTAQGVTSLNDGEELSCTIGRGKKVYIVINGNDANVGESGGYASNIKTEASLLAQHFLLTQNAQDAESPAEGKTLDNFQMIGRTLDQHFTPGANEVDVLVTRAVARVKINKITRQFQTALDGSFSIKKIYMSNAVNSRPYSGWNSWKAASDADADGANWYNKYAFNSQAADPEYAGSISIDSAGALWLVADYTSDPISLADNTSSTGDGFGGVFYVMPNDAPWGTGSPAVCGPFGGSSWSKRHTKLVVETEYDGKTYFYAIPIAKNGVYPIGKAGDDGTGWAGIQSNYTYEISELVLTKLGSTNPDEPVLPATANFEIQVEPWEVVPMATDSEGAYII